MHLWSHIIAIYDGCLLYLKAFWPESSHPTEPNPTLPKTKSGPRDGPNYFTSLFQSVVLGI